MEKKTFTRREMIACVFAGGVVTATGLWWPGQKLISIAKYVPSVLDGPESQFRLVGNTLEYIGPSEQGVSIKELHDWLVENNPFLLQERITHHLDGVVELANGYRIKNPEHLTHGSIIQDSGQPEWMQGGANKEIWSNISDFQGDELVTDKVYFGDTVPKRFRERITLSEAGDRGLA